MKRFLLFLVVSMLCYSVSYAWNIFGSTTNWNFGPTQPTIVQAQQHGSGPMVDVMQVAPGASASFYEVDPTDGEGNLIMWVYDSAIDMKGDATDTAPQWGPRWGVRNSLNQIVYACVCRDKAVAYSKGYEVGGNMSPYSYIWYNWQSRGGAGNFVANWYKWEFDVTFNDLTIKQWGPGAIAINEIYTATDGIIGSFMGNGANGVFIMGDTGGTTPGPETFKFDDASGTGVFTNVSGTTAVNVPYKNTTWGNIKALYH